MAVNGSLLGRETGAFISKGSEWGVENPSGKGFQLLEDGISHNQEMIAFEENGSVWPTDVDVGTVSTALDYRQYLRFDDLRGLAYTLGSKSYSDPVEVNSGKGDYRHTLYPSGDNFGEFTTIAFKKGTIVQVLPSVKYAGFTISGQVNPGRMETRFHTFANNLKTDSPGITSSSFDNLQFLHGNGGIAFFRNLRVWINDRDGAELAESDLLRNSLTSFEFSFQRQLVSDYTNCSGFEIEEPVEDGIAETAINLSFRNYNDDLHELFDSWKLNGRYKLKMEITGAAASTETGDVHPATFRIEVPNANLANISPASYSGPGRISGSADFKAMAVPGDLTVSGMPWKQPFRCQVVNNQETKAIS